MTLFKQVAFIVLLILLGVSCTQNKKKPLPNSSTRYDFLNPVIIKLPESLAEISGITYYPKDTSVFAIEDEDGLLYKIGLTKNNDIHKWRFDKKHDFEDVVLRDSIFYVLISNGDIEKITFGKDDSITTTKDDFLDADKKINEFESLYYDDSIKQMVLLCKNCEIDNKNSITAWGYNIDSPSYTPSVFTIDVKPIDEQLQTEKIKLRPSAAAINPVTNDLYIVSSINHLIVVTDIKGVFKELYQLDPAIYKQSEGIAFTPKGDIIISNESHETGVANILIIKNRKKGS